MNELIVKNDVRSMILEVRGIYVMMDRDVAKLFGMENKRINETVKRNINRFNEKNYFRLTKEEFELLKSQNSNLKSQFATSKGGSRYLPYVFTKDGIIVLASILRIKNDLILEIIDAFEKAKHSSNIVIKNDENIADYIYEIRGNRVILDFDLARFYECKNGTKEVNQAVKNNLEKFPERYCFQIMENEYDEFLRSKFLTSKIEDGRGGRRYLPYAFTEEGVLMLATILLNFVIIYIFL